MTGDEVKQIRIALGRELGRNVSCRDLGLALRLSVKTAADTVRGWEDGSKDVTGPASVALRFMAEAARGAHPVTMRLLFEQCFNSPAPADEPAQQ